MIQLQESRAPCSIYYGQRSLEELTFLVRLKEGGNQSVKTVTCCRSRLTWAVCLEPSHGLEILPMCFGIDPSNINKSTTGENALRGGGHRAAVFVSAHPVPSRRGCSPIMLQSLLMNTIQA